jgi:hypothetical protein
MDSPAPGTAHTYDPGLWRIDPVSVAADEVRRWTKTLAGLALSERLDAITAWCDTTEAENRTALEHCGQPGCAMCKAERARLECVAQVRALLVGES